MSTLVRALYWTIFVLLFVSTFLRTHVSLITVNNGPTTLLRGSLPEKDGTFPRRVSTFSSTLTSSQQQQQLQYQQSIQRGSPLPPRDESARKEEEYPQLSITNVVLPGMHNPHSTKFFQDAGVSVEQEYFAKFGKQQQQIIMPQTNQRRMSSSSSSIINAATTSVTQSSSNRNNKNTTTTTTDKKVDWWALMQSYERNNNKVKKMDSREIGPRSPFVERLYRIKDEIMVVANRTAVTTMEASPIPSPLHPWNDGWRSQLAKTHPDQPVDFVEPILPPPRLHFHDDHNHNHQNGTTTTTTNHTPTVVVVLVLSHQGSFIQRQSIRETWASHSTTTTTTTTSYNKKHPPSHHHRSVQVLFVVAQSDCAELEHDLWQDRRGGDVDERNSKIEMNDDIHQDSSNPLLVVVEGNNTEACDEVDHNFLRLEQEQYQDLLEIPMKESYTRLPEKLLQAYHWTLKNIPTVEWIVKSDDDMFVRVPNLIHYLDKYNHNIPMVIGDIIYHSKVSRIGKWAELVYPNDYYPYWPKGSAGHVISRAAVQYFSEMSETLYRYQGEDTSIGIWLEEAQKANLLQESVTYIHAKHMFESHGKKACFSQKYIIIGHNLLPDEMLECQNHTRTEEFVVESAWLDDPSEFQDMIRYEMGQGNPRLDWHKSVVNNNNNNNYARTGLPSGGNVIGYKANIPLN